MSQEELNNWLVKERDSLSATVARLTQEKSTLRDDLHIVTEEANTIADRLSKAHGRQDKLQTIISQMSEKAIELKERNDQLQTSVVVLAESEAELIDELAKSNTSADKLKTMFEHLVITRNNLLDEVEFLRSSPDSPVYQQARSTLGYSPASADALRYANQIVTKERNVLLDEVKAIRHELNMSYSDYVKVTEDNMALQTKLHNIKTVLRED